MLQLGLRLLLLAYVAIGRRVAAPAGPKPHRHDHHRYIQRFARAGMPHRLDRRPALSLNRMQQHLRLMHPAFGNNQVGQIASQAGLERVSEDTQELTVGAQDAVSLSDDHGLRRRVEDLLQKAASVLAVVACHSLRVLFQRLHQQHQPGPFACGREGLHRARNHSGSAAGRGKQTLKALSARIVGRRIGAQQYLVHLDAVAGADKAPRQIVGCRNLFVTLDKSSHGQRFQPLEQGVARIEMAGRYCRQTLRRAQGRP